MMSFFFFRRFSVYIFFLFSVLSLILHLFQSWFLFSFSFFLNLFFFFFPCSLFVFQKSDSLFILIIPHSSFVYDFASSFSSRRYSSLCLNLLSFIYLFHSLSSIFVIRFNSSTLPFIWRDLSRAEIVRCNGKITCEKKLD